MSPGHKCCISFSLMRFEAMFCLSAFLSSSPSFVFKRAPECLRVVPLCVRVWLVCVSGDMQSLDSLLPYENTTYPGLYLSIFLYLAVFLYLLLLLFLPHLVVIVDGKYRQHREKFDRHLCWTLGCSWHCLTWLVSGWNAPDGISLGVGRILRSCRRHQHISKNYIPEIYFISFLAGTKFENHFSAYLHYDPIWAIQSQVPSLCTCVQI